MNGNTAGYGRFSECRAVGGAVIGIQEDDLPVVTALLDEVRLAGHGKAGQSRHQAVPLWRFKASMAGILPPWPT